MDAGVPGDGREQPLPAVSYTHLVKGNRIDIVSRQGGVGTAATALKVETPDAAVDALNPLSSSVNVTAKGNIHLAEGSDMRVGTIKSTGGNEMCIRDRT